MNKLRTGMISLAIAGSLLAGSAMADAAPGGNGKGSSEKSSKPSTSQVQKNNSHTNDNSEQTKETKATNANNGNTVKKSSNDIKTKHEVKTFKDVNNNHWAKGPIERLQIMGIASGFPDGTFHPEASVTQDQVISMLVRVIELQDEAETTETTINDTQVTDTNIDENNIEEAETTEEKLKGVPDWAKGAVAKAEAEGIVNLNRFHSGVQASRVQSMIWLAKAIGLEPVDTTNLPFKDGTLVSSEDVGYVMALYQEGLVAGGPDGKLNPNSAVTRAQIAALIDRVLTEEQTEDIDTFQSVETVDGQKIIKIGSGEDAQEIELAENVEVYINGELAELSDLVEGTEVNVETNTDGLAVKIEQTVEETTTEDETSNEEEDNTEDDTTNA
ncbi:hypothetical protein JCM14036_13950 [Desulfotomaculum defluvii]